MRLKVLFITSIYLVIVETFDYSGQMSLIPQTVKPKNAVKNTSKAKPANIQPAATQSVLKMTSDQTSRKSLQ